MTNIEWTNKKNQKVEITENGGDLTITVAGKTFLTGDLKIENNPKYGEMIAKAGAMEKVLIPAYKDNADLNIAIVKLVREHGQNSTAKINKAGYKKLNNGVCPKCGTYCYGDCEAN